MDRQVVIKYLKRFSIGFIIISIIEIVDLILLSTIIEINIDAQTVNMIELLLNSAWISFHGIFLLFFLLIIPFGFAAIGLAIFMISRRENLDDFMLAKFIMMTGLIFLLGSFIKAEYIVLLSDTELTLSVPVSFQNILYNPSNTPFIGAVMWIYPMSLFCVFLTSGMIFGGIGLKWFLIIDREKKSTVNKS